MSRAATRVAVLTMPSAQYEIMLRSQLIEKVALQMTLQVGWSSLSPPPLRSLDCFRSFFSGVV